jgi:hypothetical protein
MNKLWTRPGAALVIGIVLGLVLGFRTHNFGLWLILRRRPRGGVRSHELRPPAQRER